MCLVGHLASVRCAGLYLHEKCRCLTGITVFAFVVNKIFQETDNCRALVHIEQAAEVNTLDLAMDRNLEVPQKMIQKHSLFVTMNDKHRHEGRRVEAKSLRVQPYNCTMARGEHFG